MESTTQIENATGTSWRAPLGVALLAVLAHAASLSCGWIWDDDSYITANPVIQSPSGLLSIWVPGETPQYYPLVFLGFWLQHLVVGLEPFSYHLVNVLMHAANAVLLLLLIRRAGVDHAFWIAAIFAVHPMGVESVAWVTERKNVQSMMFALASMIVFLRMVDAGKGTRLQPWIAAFLLFMAALLSKTTAVFVPPCLVLVLLWRRRRVDRSVGLALVPFFAAGIALGLFTAFMEKEHVGAIGTPFAISALERLQLAGRTATFYATHFLVPTEQIFIYPRFQIDVGSVYAWMPLLMWLAAFSFAIIVWKRTRAPLLVLLWIGAGLFPALGFFNVWPFIYSFVADHFAYAAMPAFAVVLVAAIVALGKRMPSLARLGVPIGAIGLAAGIALSVRATPKYESEEILWRTTLEQNPTAWIAANNIASILLPRAGALAQQGRGAESAAVAGEALRFARIAGELNPDEFTNAVNRSEAHRLLGEPELALAEIELAARLAPRISDVHWVRAMVLESLGRRDEARGAFEQAAALATKVGDESAARRELLRLAAADRDVERATAECTRLVQLDPRDTDMRANLGSLLVAAGRREEARIVLLDVAGMPVDAFSRESVWMASSVAYLQLAIDTSLSATEATEARTIAARLVTVSRGDALARYLSLALALTLGDESAREQIARIADDARRAGVPQFADEIAAFLARRPRVAPGGP